MSLDPQDGTEDYHVNPDYRHPAGDEPQFRLVPDENDPATLASLAAAPYNPRLFEQDPGAANYCSAQQAAAAALSTGGHDARDDRERVQDLLTNLFHLCDLLALDMDELVDAAQRHYAAEIEGEI